MRRWVRVLLFSFLSLLVMFWAVAGIVGYFGTKVTREPVSENPGAVGLSYVNVTFPSRVDFLNLSGWYIPGSNTQQTIILVHGADGNRLGPDGMLLQIARGLVTNGFNVLMFDLRGHGDSEGDQLSGGTYEQRDLLGAVDFAKKQGAGAIGVIGFSMGAVTSLLAAASDPDIKAVVADSGFANSSQLITGLFSQYTKLPGVFALPLLFGVKTIFNLDFSDIDPVNCVSKIAPRPILYIHGDDDKLIPEQQSEELQQASTNSYLWLVPDGEHARSYESQPVEYMSVVLKFFSNALNGRLASAFPSGVTS